MQNCVRGLLSDKCCTCLFISVAVTLPIVSLVVVAFFIFMSYIAHRRYPHIGETGKSRHRNKPLYVYITHLGTSFYGKWRHLCHEYASPFPTLSFETPSKRTPIIRTPLFVPLTADTAHLFRKHRFLCPISAQIRGSSPLHYSFVQTDCVYWRYSSLLPKTLCSPSLTEEEHAVDDSVFRPRPTVRLRWYQHHVQPCTCDLVCGTSTAVCSRLLSVKLRYT